MSIQRCEWNMLASFSKVTLQGLASIIVHLHMYLKVLALYLSHMPHFLHQPPFLLQVHMSLCTKINVIHITLKTRIPLFSCVTLKRLGSLGSYFTLKLWWLFHYPLILAFIICKSFLSRLIVCLIVVYFVTNSLTHCVAFLQTRLNTL